MVSSRGGEKLYPRRHSVIGKERRQWCGKQEVTGTQRNPQELRPSETPGFRHHRVPINILRTAQVVNINQPLQSLPLVTRSMRRQNEQLPLRWEGIRRGTKDRRGQCVCPDVSGNDFLSPPSPQNAP